MQIIILCESNSTAKTDYKYIKATIDQFFDVGKNRLSKIFLGTKSNYCKVEKQIQQLRKKYREVNPKARSVVIECLDFDDPMVPDNLITNKQITDYCHTKGYELIWFHRDIEEVFLKECISDKKKVQFADDFVRKNMIKDFDTTALMNNEHKQYTSNLMIILKKHLPLRK